MRSSCPFDDRASVDVTELPGFVASIGFPIVIDHAFHSANLELISHEVIDGEGYGDVSDHFPLLLAFEYDAL